MVKVDIIDKISIPEGVEVSIDSNQINVKGPKGELSRGIFTPGIKIEVKENEVIFSIKKAAKKEKMVLKTTEAHLKNMINGVNEEYVYKLKICSGHFPMNVSISGNKFTVKNFLGEKVPRIVTFSEKVLEKLIVLKADIVGVCTGCNRNSIEVVKAIKREFALKKDSFFRFDSKFCNRKKITTPQRIWIKILNVR